MAKENIQPQEQLFTKAQLDEQLKLQREEFEKKLAETEKIAKMNAEEQTSYLNKQAEEKLARREEAVARRERCAAAAEKLREKKLPAKLIACVSLASEEECEKSIAALGECFSSAVEEGISERIVFPPLPKKPSAQTENDPFLTGLRK